MGLSLVQRIGPVDPAKTDFRHRLLGVYCNHLSVRLKHRPTRPMILGVVQAHARWAGLGVGSLVAVFLAMSLTSIGAAAFMALMVGWYGQLLGVAVIRAWRWFVRAIG